MGIEIEIKQDETEIDRKMDRPKDEIEIEREW